MMIRMLLLAGMVLLLAGCRPETYTPRPRAYFHIEFPERGYRQFDNPDYPYTFEYPVYAVINRDSVFFDEKPDNPFWVKMEIPELSAQLFITYKRIGPSQVFEKLIEDAHKMSYFHDVRADYISDHLFHAADDVHGVLYQVGGNAASSTQFYATDSSRHFLWGALYFDATPNADSLRPVNEFLRDDLKHLLNTLRWR